jgi:hypothetical protein
MNCGNHPDIVAEKFCRTCGKPLCASCTRDVHGVVYCENCLAARLEGVQPQQTAYQQVMDQGLGLKVPPGPATGPNPTVAGILAGFFPVGVGAVYNTQYAKGFAHLLIFVGLIWGLSSGPESIAPVLGLGLAFFYFYQIIDAVRSAKAIQMGQPAPDPFGLGKTFSAGEKVDSAKIPTGAIILIGLGVLFMLHNLGLWFFNMDRFWPVILIAIGVWLFARRWGAMGASSGTCACDRCRARVLMGPAVLVTLGTLFLLEKMYVVSFHRTWPVLLVVIGLVKVFQGNASTSGHMETPLPPSGAGPTGVVTGEIQPPSSEVHHG